MTDTLADKLEALAKAVARPSSLRLLGYDATADVIGLLPAILRALRERDQAVEALRTAEAAITEYYRYWTGGETRGSYDGKPERTGLWCAQNKARQTLASIEGAGDA